MLYAVERIMIPAHEVAEFDRADAVFSIGWQLANSICVVAIVIRGQHAGFKK